MPECYSLCAIALAYVLRTKYADYLCNPQNVTFGLRGLLPPLARSPFLPEEGLMINARSKAPSGEDGAKTGSVFAPRLYPSPPKCGRRFGFAENGDSRVSYFTASKGAYDILRMNTEGRRKEFGCHYWRREKLMLP